MRLLKSIDAPDRARCSKMLLAAGSVCALGVAAVCGMAQDGATKAAPALQAVTEMQEAPELAFLMGELQRLTHKMALSADAGNAELAAFYMHESLEQLQKIQKESPEYEGQPVAVLIDRMGLPAYEGMRQAVAEKPARRERMIQALDAVINQCNACHTATLHPFITITRGTEVNPFNQSFAPR